MAKVIAKLKTKEDFIYKFSSKESYAPKNDIIISEISKRNGFVKGVVDYGNIKNFGIVRLPFQFAIFDAFGEDGFDDWTYEDGEKIPYMGYILSTIELLNEKTLLNK
jgi:hypothetical protein